MPAQATSSDPARCPLCGQFNGCAMEMEKVTGLTQPPCWCTQVSFSDALLARVAPQARNLACICPACAVTTQPE